MIIYVDIDGTICTEVPDDATGTKLQNIEIKKNYMDAKPYTERIEYINSLYDKGHTIHYWTARGCWDGEDYLQETREQLDSWGVKYNDVAVFKPLYDMWIDDKAVSVWNDYEKDSDGNISDFESSIKKKIEVL